LVIDNETDAKSYLRKLLQDIEDLKIARDKFDQTNKEHFDQVAQKEIFERELADLKDEVEHEKSKLREMTFQFASKQQQYLTVVRKLSEIKASIPDG
jgi:DNA repair exonuclease SbcCD ATPase subunit